jgi:16S rRNA processing protein RimM
MPKSYRLVAGINRSRGLKGEVEVRCIDGLLSCLRPDAELWVVPPPERGVRRTHIVSRRGDENVPWLFLHGVNDREAAMPLIGHYLLAAEHDIIKERPGPGLEHTPADNAFDDRLETSKRPPLPPDGTGLQVVDERHGLLGTIIEESRATPQTLWTVEGPFGLVLIPAVEAFVRGWDDASVTVDLPAGLLDLNR